jgi:hypothetical protein
VSHRHLVIERSRVAVSTAREVSVIVGYQFSRGGTIELGDDDRAPRGARSGQGAGELWAALEDELAEDGQALRGKSARHRLVGSLP